MLWDNGCGDCPLFQFLIGRLDTWYWRVIAFCLVKFQFLIGRLDTLSWSLSILLSLTCFNSLQVGQILIHGFQSCRGLLCVSIPYRQARYTPPSVKRQKTNSCFNSLQVGQIPEFDLLKVHSDPSFNSLQVGQIPVLAAGQQLSYGRFNSLQVGQILIHGKVKTWG